MIEVDKIVKTYAPNFRLEIDSLLLTSSEIVSIIGNNGAGKTTLINILLDLILPDSGDIRIREKSNKLEHWKKYTTCFLGLDYLPDFLSVNEYINLVAALNKISKEQLTSKLDYFKEFLYEDFSKLKNIRINNLSRGNKDKIGIVASLLFDPDILIMDEPFPHLDPRSRIILSKLFVDLKDRANTLIIISSHDIDIVEKISSRFLVLDNGRLHLNLSSSNTNIEQIRNHFNKDY